MAVGAVFVFEPVFDDFELELADGADDAPVAGLLGEELGDAFIGELFEALFLLHGFHGVVIDELFENLR